MTGMTGPQLKEQRAQAGITGAALAARMGLGRTRIPQIEAQAIVPDATVKRYLAALIELAAEARSVA